MPLSPETITLIAAILWGIACWVAAAGTSGLSPVFPHPHKLARVEIGMRAVLYASVIWLLVALLQLPGDVSRLFAAQVVLSVAIIETDLRRLLIPDTATLGLVVMAIASAAFGHGPDLIERFLGAALGFLMFWGVRAYFERRNGHESLGWGDVKLAGAMGASVGLWSFPVALLIACAVTAILFLRPRRDAGGVPKPVAPLGVGMAAAIVLVPLAAFLALK